MSIKELYSIFERCHVVTTDSRDCPVGSIFFALRGETFNGNKFAQVALDKGCAYAVVDDKEYATDERCILVDDCLQTLKLLAREHRRHFDIPVIGITGTNGKTTTKELVSAVLAEKYNVMHTEGNFNNDIGVPKTLLRLNSKHEIAVVEMGASHPGDIKTLVETAEPNYGLITNVGRAHLQGFGSFEGVVKTKGELYDFLRTRPNGTIFIDAGNTYLMNMSQGLTLVKYGIANGSPLDVEGQIVSCSPLLTFRWRKNGGEWHNVSSQMIGAYNIYNMLAAASVGLYFGVSGKQVCQALESYRPSNSRSQLLKTERNTLIVDAYNANPTSMMAALQNFKDIVAEHKMAILGDMRELGETSDVEHQRIVDFLCESGITDVWLVGSEFAKTNCTFRKFANVDEVKQALNKETPTGRYILVKGSNGTKLHQLPPLL